MSTDLLFIGAAASFFFAFVVWLVGWVRNNERRAEQMRQSNYLDVADPEDLDLINEPLDGGGAHVEVESSSGCDTSGGSSFSDSLDSMGYGDGD